jgi:hypothetical protein
MITALLKLLASIPLLAKLIKEIEATWNEIKSHKRQEAKDVAVDAAIDRVLSPPPGEQSKVDEQK